MIARYNNISLALGIPGLILQLAGSVLTGMHPEYPILGGVTVVAGTALLIAGLAMYAKAKGRSPAWGLMGFLSLIGVLGLGELEDRAPPGKPGRA